MPTAASNGRAGLETEKYVLECIDCGRSQRPALRFRCERCSGALEAVFRLDPAPPATALSTLRYLPLLPLESDEFLDHTVARPTPCIPAPTLGKIIGVPNLWVKDESRQPTGSTKDRLAAVALAVFRQFGVTEFVASSTGNTAIALARAVRRSPDMRAHFFCGRDFVDMHDLPQDERVRLTAVDGSYAAASAAAKAYATEHGILWEGGFFNWARREGLKLAYLEAFDAMEIEPDVVVQAISSGMGIMAARKGAEEYRRLGRLTKTPRFLMVQQDTCAPMADAWRDGRDKLTDEDVVERPDGLARAILLGDGRASYPYMRDIALASGGAIRSVRQRELVEARSMLCELEDLDVCYSSAAAIAAVRNEAADGRIAADDTVLVNLTGRRRPQERAAQAGRAEQR
jgi:threonine synthase